MPAKVVILSVGDAQYPQDTLGSVITSVREGVASLTSAEVVGAYTIMDDKDADLVASEVSEKVFDAIIVSFVSWHITPYVMRTLKNYRDKPILVWGIGGWTDASGKLIAPAAAAGTTALVPLLKEMGYRYMVLNQKPNEALRLQTVELFLYTVGAVQAVHHSRIGLFGYADMGLFSCSYNKTLAFEKLGVDIEDYSAYDLVHHMASFSDEAVAEAVADIKRKTVFENTIKDETIAKVARLYLVMQGKKNQRGLDAVPSSVFTA